MLSLKSPATLSAQRVALVSVKVGRVRVAVDLTVETLNVVAQLKRGHVHVNVTLVNVSQDQTVYIVET